jgi:hypothetical protein
MAFLLPSSLSGSGNIAAAERAGFIAGLAGGAKWRSGAQS